MAELKKQQTALGDVAARQLAIATRSVPTMATSPRWLTHLLHLGSCRIWGVSFE